MTDTATVMPGGGRNAAADLLALYDRALPQVYGYLVRRCDSVAIAEDLTSESFMAAANALLTGSAEQIGIGWLIGTARHKLIDHWRRAERHQSALRLVATSEQIDDPMDDTIETKHAHDILMRLSAEHRSALTLRYIDGLPVNDVAEILGRSVHATESLLQRAKSAFRHASAEIDEPRRGDLP